MERNDEEKKGERIKWCCFSLREQEGTQCEAITSCCKVKPYLAAGARTVSRQSATELYV